MAFPSTVHILKDSLLFLKFQTYAALSLESVCLRYLNEVKDICRALLCELILHCLGFFEYSSHRDVPTACNFSDLSIDYKMKARLLQRTCILVIVRWLYKVIGLSLPTT